MEAPERLDLLVHAVAQGPASARALVIGDGPDRPRLERLARAHGLSDRVVFEAGADAGPDDLVVYPSTANLAAARITPAEAPAAAVLPDWPEPLARPPDRPAGPPPAGATPTTTFAELVEGLYGADDGAAPARRADGLLAGQRIVVVVNIPTHYRVPLFGGVAARLAERGADFRVIFLGEPYARRSWMVTDRPAFDHATVRSLGVPLSREWHPFVPARLGRELARFDPSLVVSAGFSPLVSGVVARFAARRRIPFGLWSGETALMGSANDPWRAGVRRWLIRRAGFALAYGHAAGEYLRGLRPGLAVALVRNSTPVLEGAPPRTSSAGADTRILCVADLSSPRKGIDLVIDALAGLTDRRWTLTVAGGGPGLEPLRERARPLGDRVRFLGAVPSDQVGREYAAADVFAMPSRDELFGLVLVEAMGAGLATLVSNQTGAVADLCADGANAVVIAPNEVAAWRAALDRVIAEPALRDRLGAAGAATVRRRWSLDRSADAFVAGLRLGVLQGATP
jgi:glycosyltransferase involved in cell wall biosynthesis